MNEQIARLTALIEPVLDRLGYELVRVRLSGGQNAVLQIMAETPQGVCLIEDCERISRALSELFDAADPLPFAYRLEVSSPGIDRPLTRPKDFTNWAGHAARINLAAPQDGRKRFTGQLKGLDGESAVLETETGCVVLPLARIESARLLLTDDLIRATAPPERALRGPAARSG